MGIIYDHLKCNDKALENYEKSMNIKKKLFGNDSKEVGDILNNMGAIHLNKMNFKMAL